MIEIDKVVLFNRYVASSTDLPYITSRMSVNVDRLDSKLGVDMNISITLKMPFWRFRSAVVRVRIDTKFEIQSFFVTVNSSRLPATVPISISACQFDCSIIMRDIFPRFLVR